MAWGVDAADLRHGDRLIERLLSARPRSRQIGWLPPRGGYKVKEPVM
jgi:hypothetical protein